jgi:hypothetical protein
MEVESPVQARMMAISKSLKILGDPSTEPGRILPGESFVSLSLRTVNSYCDDG